MKSFLEEDERKALESLKTHPDDAWQRAAQVILLADQGMPIRRTAAVVGLSRSGAFYWVRRFRRLKLAMFDRQPEGFDQGKLAADDDEYSTPANQEIASNHALNDGEKSSFPLPQLQLNPGVLPGDTFAEAGRKILLYHFAQMLSHEAGTILGEDIEALHDMRVATRRMRAAFALFTEAYKPKKIKHLLKGLRLTGRALGSVRDLDVFLEKVNGYQSSLPEDQKSGLNSLLQVWQAQRNKYRAAMVAHLESPGYQEFKHNLNLFLQAPEIAMRTNSGKPYIASGENLNYPEKIRQIIPLLIYTRLAAVSAYEDQLSTATIPQLHALRIEFKRLRYAVEFFTEILGPQAKMVIIELKQMQDHLGELHDADVACLNLSQVINDWENQHSQIPLTLRPEPGAVIAYLSHCSYERHRLLSSFPKAWENFNRPEVRENLALAIAAL